MEKKHTESADVHVAVSEFYRALNELFKGDTAPMIALWSHEKDVSYLGPQGGILIGWDKVHKAWREQAELRLNGAIEPHEIHLILSENVAIAQNYEIGTNVVDNKPQKVKIRATNVFRHEGGKWKMISHQTDPLPYLK